MTLNSSQSVLRPLRSSWNPVMTTVGNKTVEDKVHEGSKSALSQKLMKFCYSMCVCLP